MNLVGLVALVLLVTVVPAAANGLDLPDVAGPLPDETLRGEVGLGIIAGGFEAGETGDIASGAQARIGLRYDRWLALTRGVIVSLGKPGAAKHDPEDGYALRSGLELRYSFSQAKEVSMTKTGRPVAIVRRDFWLGAGVGLESVTWRTEGGFARRYVDLAVGYTILGHWGKDGSNHATLDFALELDEGHAPTSRTDSTLTDAIDHSILLSMTVSTGA